MTQNGVPFMQPDEIRSTKKCFSEIFRDNTFYVAAVPTYIGGIMSFGWGTDNLELNSTTLETLQNRFAASGLTTRYYTPEIHQASFSLPQFVLDIIQE